VTGKWSLTPAYDLTYTEGYLQRGTQVAGEVRPKPATMEALSHDAGVTAGAFQIAVADVCAALKKWTQWADAAGLPGARRAEISARFGRIQKEVFG
jgi:hypothetical protein